MPSLPKLNKFLYPLFFLFLGFYVFRVFSLCFYGIDFSDEGRHLNEIRFSYSYSWAASQYGILLHPIANLLNFNLPALRVLNLFFTFFLSAFAAAIQINKSASNLKPNRSLVLAICLSFGLFGLTFFNLWLPTPSYYSLTFQSLLIFWISFKYVDIRKNMSVSLRKIAVLSLATTLVFLAKPSTFLIVGLISVASIWVYAKNKTFSTFSYVLTTIIFLTMFSLVSFANPLHLFERVFISSRFMSIQDPLYRLENVFRFDPFPFSWELLLLIFIFTFLIASLVRIFTKLRGDTFSVTVVSHFVVISLVIFVFAKNYNFLSNPIILFIASIFLSFSLVTNLSWKEKSLLKRAPSSNAALLLLPFAYAIGSNGNLWVVSAQAIFFLVLYSLEIVLSINGKSLQEFSQKLILAICLPLAVFSLEYGISHPYRQMSSIEEQKANAIQDRNMGYALIEKDVEHALQQMYVSAAKVGLRAGQPIIDLTGQSPLALFSLKAYPVGSPWMVGGYSGSNTLAIEVLKEVRCSMLINAWVLTEPGGPRSLNAEEVLNSFGSNLENYKDVATWYTPKGSGGYLDRRVQKLYKPVNLENKSRIVECNAKLG